MSGKYHPEQAKLLWDTGLGFLGFMTLLAMVQAVMNIFADEPLMWPGFVAAGFMFAAWLCYRGKQKYFQHIDEESCNPS